MKTSPHLATRIFNTPHLIHPAKANIILRALGPRLGIDAGMFDDDVVVAEDTAENETPGMQDGLCVIPVFGTLVKRSTGMDAMSGLTSYGDIRECAEDAMADPECKGIVFDFDSPGGEVSGMFELADYISSLRGQKPIYGVADDAAYSAAYALASCCDKIYLTSIAGVGSIGCYCLYVDQSEYDKKLGVKYNYIFAGDRKIDGNPNEPLSDEARATAQAEVDRIRDMFVTLVAKNRNVTAQAVMDTQAGCYFGADAIPLLADKIGTLDDALNDMAALLKIERTVKPPVAAATPISPQEREMPPHDTAAEIAKLARIALGTHSQGWADRQFSAAELPLLAVRSSHASTSAHVPGIPNVDRQISCTVAPYNQLSCDLGGFREIYQPGCFSESLASRDDFRALSNHNPDYVLGRRSAGTAEFYETADGLCFRVDAPETQWADDLLVSMRRGDITQGSAAFYILNFRWAYEGSQKIRVIEKAALVEASVSSFAAYDSTEATVAQQQAIAAQHEQYGARLRLFGLVA